MWPKCVFSSRLATAVGPHQTLSSKARNLSSPSLHMYYNQSRKKNSGSEACRRQGTVLEALQYWQESVNTVHLVQWCNCIVYININILEADTCLSTNNKNNVSTIDLHCFCGDHRSLDLFKAPHNLHHWTFWLIQHFLHPRRLCSKHPDCFI